MEFRHIAMVPLALALAGCLSAGGLPGEVARRAALPEDGLAEGSAAPPAGAAAGTCWAAPAQAEVVTERILLTPPELAGDGSILREAEYVEATEPAGGAPRPFETPCPSDLTPAFAAALQRALTARGAYSGPVTGALDDRTRFAIRDWQAPRGLDTGILAMTTARALGLIAYPEGDPRDAPPEDLAEAPPEMPEPGTAGIY